MAAEIRLNCMRIILVIMFLGGANELFAQIHDRWHIELRTQERPQFFTYNSKRYLYFTFELKNTLKETNCPLMLDLTAYVEKQKSMVDDKTKLNIDVLKDVLRDNVVSCKKCQTIQDFPITKCKKCDTDLYGAIKTTANSVKCKKCDTDQEFPTRKCKKCDADLYDAIKEKDHKGYQKYVLGKYCTAVISPEVEYRLIEHIAGLSNRTKDVIKASIDEFKNNGYFLSLAEIRKKKVLKPGQKITGLAIFENIDEDAIFLEIFIAGVFDFVNIISIVEGEMELEYKNDILKIVYEFDKVRAGKDEDFVRFKKRERVTKRIGPISSKDTLQKLLDTMFDQVRKENAWAKEKLKPEELDARRQKDGISKLDVNIAANIFLLATGLDFGYDLDKTILENEAAIWKIHDFWVNNKHRLTYDEGYNQFILENEKKKPTESK